MKKKRILNVFLVILLGLHLFAGCIKSDVPPEETTEPPAQADAELVINFIDVGQADCIYISLPNGETMLIDAGERVNAKAIIDYIKADGKDALDYVIATHPHADHIGGMAEVIKAFDVKNVYMPRVLHTTVTFERLLDTIEEKGLTIQSAKAGKTIFEHENIKAVFLAPAKDSYTNLNNYSAVVKLSYNNKSFLFMGDAEKVIEDEIMASGQNVAADVIKIGHHGSRTSTTKSFIEAVNPSVAVIFAGKDNDYKHPDTIVLSRLNVPDIDIWRTDEKGTIIITCDGERITIGGV